MKRDLFVIALCFVAGLGGANVQPILTGAGKMIFPENATPATISASSGALTLAAGGTPPQNVNVKPSGTGEVQISANTATLPASPVGTLLHLGNADSTGTRLTMDAFANIPTLQFRRYDGTAALPTAVQLNEVLGRIFWGGYGATAVSTNRAQLQAFATEAWTDTAQGTALQVITTPTGGVATAEVARFFGSGGFSVNSTTDPGAGVINAQSGFAKGGTAGISPTLTYLKSSGVTCTASFSGGIITVTGGVGCP